MATSPQEQKRKSKKQVLEFLPEHASSLNNLFVVAEKAKRAGDVLSMQETAIIFQDIQVLANRYLPKKEQANQEKNKSKTP